MAARRDALKFVRLLAKQLQDRNDGDWSPDDLEQHFRGAVNSLPEGDLKRSLDQGFSYFKNQLISALKPLMKAVQEDSTHQSPQYNLFVKGCLDKVIKSSASLPMDQEMELYQKLWQCYPAVPGTETLFSIFPEFLREKYQGGTDSQRLENSLEMIKKYQQMTFGCYDEESVVNSMKLILEEISSTCDECSKLSCAQERQQRATLLQNVIRNVVVLTHFRFEEHKRQETGHCCKDFYSDLMAALLSLYLDVNLLSERKDLLKDAGNSLFLILGHSPSHLMDVLIQLTTLSEDNIVHVLPLIRLVLKKNSGMLRHSTYIKFVCLTRLACSLGTNSPEDIAAIRQVTESQSAPVDFLSWLARKDPRLSRSLAISRSISAVQITKKLLDMAKDDDVEHLLDVACDASTADGTPAEPGEAPRTDELEAAPSGEESLFFVDSTGDAVAENTFQEVEYQSNDAEEKLLHKQLTSLIDRLDDESESEDDVMIDDILLSSGDTSQRLPPGTGADAFDTEEDETAPPVSGPAAGSHNAQVAPSPLASSAGEQSETLTAPAMGNVGSSDEEEEAKGLLSLRRSKRSRLTPKKALSDEENEPTQSEVKKEPRRSLRQSAARRGRSVRTRK